MAQVRRQEGQPKQATKELSQDASDAARTGLNAAAGAGQTGMDAAAGNAWAGAEMLQRNAQTLHEMWEAGSKMAGQFIQQSTQQFARVFGIAGGGAQQQAMGNMESIIQSGTILSKGMQSISRELFDLANQRLDQNLRRANSLMRCRTPQELVAEYSEFVRENMDESARSTRRLMELSMQIADEAALRMKQPTPG
jgi:hypothetical protein